MPSAYFETVKTFLLDLGYAITEEDPAQEFGSGPG